MAPHAENDMNNKSLFSAPLVNGEKQMQSKGLFQSKVLSHLQSYPVIQDSLVLYQKNPYGAKSLSLFNETYNRVVAPFHPYLETPYSYLSPYLTRADELGDNGLSKVDSTFPIVKEDTGKLKETVQAYAFAPLKFAGHGKEYVMGTWQDEYKKTRGNEGIFKSVKALISTELKIGIDGYNFVSEFLGQRKQQASKKNELKNELKKLE